MLWKCAAIGVTAATLSLSIRKRSEEQSFLLGLLAAVMILCGVLNASEPLAGLIRSLEQRSGIDSSLLSPVVKSLGLSILGRLTEGFCRDAGHSAAAFAVELATSFSILCTAVPLVEALLDVVFSAV